jgi:hypothetical protein
MEKFAKYHKVEWMVFSVWFLLWFGLGTHMYETFNISSYYLPNFNFLRANLIFYIFAILLGYFLYYREKTEYLIFSLYPILGFFGFILNSKESIYFGLHNSISLLAIALFINFISSKNINKKLIFYLLHYSTIFILSIFFILFIGPDFVKKILSFSLGARGENAIDIIFSKNITFHIPQNSNGASRIVFLLTILLCCFYNFLLKNKFTLVNIFLLIGTLILASINIFYQSKLNILAFIICCFYIFLINNNYKNKLKILSLVLLVTLPFIINYTYQKYYNKNYDFLQNNRLFNNNEGFFTFKNYQEKDPNSNNVKKIYDKSINYKEVLNKPDTNIGELCFSHNTAMDRFFGGRICGWEILTKVYYDNFKLFGYGFFEDRKTLKELEKISSNSYLFALFNSGILSFFTLIIFYSNIFIKIIKSILISRKIKSNFPATTEFYTILTIYLIVRSFFEDTLAFLSVDLLLMVTCISFLNYFFDISNNLSKRIL